MSSSPPMAPPPGDRPPRLLAQIVAHQRLGPQLGCVTLWGPGLGRNIRAGQFAMVWRPAAPLVPASPEPRPFAYFEAPDEDRIVFLVRERPDSASSLLRAPLGTQVPLMGPLGKPFPPATGRVWAIAGGVGAAAFGPLASDPSLGTLRVMVGLRSRAEKGIEAAVRALYPDQVELVVANEEDGPQEDAFSLFERSLAVAHALPDQVFACGPEPLLKKIAAAATQRGIPVWVSVGVAMGCGTGLCHSCAVVDRHGQKHLACIDGPVFLASTLYEEGTR